MAKFKRCSIKLLSLGEKAMIKGDIGLHIANSRLYELLVSNRHTTDELAHIYVLSEDKDEYIQTDDWYYDSENNRIDQLGVNECAMSYDKKIIATTNLVMDLPRLPKKFVEKYIKSFNDNNTIEFAMIEYIGVGRMKRSGIEVPITELIKTDRNNFITIKRIKETYTKEEIKKLFNLYFKTQGKGEYESVEFDQWFDENV